MTCLEQEDSFLQIEDLRIISDIWTRIYDQEGTGFIPLQSVGRLLLDVPKPLGIAGIQSKRKAYLCIREDLRRSGLFHSQSKCTVETLKSNEGYDPLGVKRVFHFLIRAEVYFASLMYHIPNDRVPSALSSANKTDEHSEVSAELELVCHGMTESIPDVTNTLKEDHGLGNSGDFEFLEMLTGRSHHEPNSSTEIEQSLDKCEENGSQVSILDEMEVNRHVLSQPCLRDVPQIAGDNDSPNPEIVSSNSEEVTVGTIIPCRPGENGSDAINIEHSSGLEQQPLSRSQSGLTDPVGSDVMFPISDVQISSENGGDSPHSNTYDGLKTGDLECSENHVEVQLHDPSQRPNVLIQILILCCLYCVVGLRWILSLFLSRQAMQTHKMHQIRFDKVVNSMIYWNNQQNVVPLNLVESRKIYDESIVKLAARDIVVSFMRGLLERRKLRLGMKAPSMDDKSLSNQKEPDNDVDYNFQVMPEASIDHATLKHRVDLIVEYGYGRNLRMAANQRGHNLISVSELAFLSVSQISDIFDDDNIRIILDFVLAKYRQRKALEEMSAEINAIQSQSEEINLEKERLVFELHNIQESTLKLKHKLDHLKSKDLEHKLGSYAGQHSWKDKPSRKMENKDITLPNNLDSGRKSDTKLAHFLDVQHLQEVNEMSTSKHEGFHVIEDVAAKKAGEQVLIERKIITSKKLELEVNQRFVGIPNKPTAARNVIMRNVV